MALTNMHSDLRFNPFSGLCINLVISSITASQDAHKRIVVQVYHGLKTLEFSAIHR